MLVNSGRDVDIFNFLHEHYWKLFILILCLLSINIAHQFIRTNLILVILVSLTAFNIYMTAKLKLCYSNIKSKKEVKLSQTTQKLEVVRTLAGGIAHDFNNVLATIAGNVELVLDECNTCDCVHCDPNTRNNRLMGVVKSVDRASKLTKQLLTFSRQQNGYTYELINLKEFLHENAEVIKTTLGNNVCIEWDISKEISGFIKADPIQLHQIVINICSNAKYAMKNNTGTSNVTISIDEVYLDSTEIKQYTVALSPGKYILFTFTDSGSGIDEDIIDTIFDPFFTTKPINEGTGLGLSVVHGIVSTLKGSIRVYSKKGMGTSFHVILPEITKDNFKIQEDLELYNGLGERILLVDDDLALLQVTEKILERKGYKVVAMNNPIKALEVFNKTPFKFDVVITDYIMPEMSGTDLVEQILDVRPDIPIIMCSGYNDSADIIFGKDNIRFLSKPVLTSNVTKTIYELIHNYDKFKVINTL